MKLYNIYESIILEESKSILTEGLSNEEDIKEAIDGKYNVWFKYRDKSGVTDRYVQIYQVGTSKGGNRMISAYQLGGSTAKTKLNSKDFGWKQFLVNNIVNGSITISNKKWSKAVSDLPSWKKGDEVKRKDGTVTYKNDYNKSGNKNMTGTVTSITLKSAST
tara:strand:- start:68244 stop:68729 length:486 start_codon:yes stop_codon:yes gene_type:complete